MKDFFDFFKGNFFIKFLLFLYTVLSSLFTHAQTEEIRPYTPSDLNLHKQIIKMDSIYFNAYNTCDITIQNKILSNDLEFFHDKGGFTTSKNDVLEGIKNNICGKVTRTLIKGSISYK